MVSLLLCLNLLAGPSISHVDTSVVKSVILNYYYKDLPDSLQSLPWHEFQKHLDPYTRFLNEEEYAEFGDGLDGLIRESIGMYVDSNEKGFEVAKVLPESQAYKLGIARGDIITHINGEPLGDYSALVKCIISPDTSFVMYRLKRGNIARTIPIKKAPVHKSSIYSCRYNNTVLIDIHRFSSDLALLFAAHSRRAQCSTADTLILDLRGNPGGLLNQALAIGDEFLDEGKLMLRSVGREDSMNYYAHEGGLWLNVKKIIIIQDSGSASASEVLAGILLHHRDAEIIGTRSYGKGVIQQQIPIAGGVVIVTVAEYFPGGVIKIHELGLNATKPCRRITKSTLPEDFDYQKFREEYRRPSVDALKDKRLRGHKCVSHLIWEDCGVLMEMLLQKVYQPN